jgi:diguanylate cyclase (GGDEF)-like protein
VEATFNSRHELTRQFVALQQAPDAHVFEQLLRVGNAVGESVLRDNHNSLAEWDKGETGDLWLRAWVIEGELMLVHRVTRAQLWQAAARDSIGLWFVVVLITMLAIMSLRLQRTLAEVTRLTRVDPLTQAFNRRGFFESAEIAMAVAARQQLSLAVLMLDIDHFKKINDTYGHAAGDAVLKQLGANLLHACRPSDVFCRWGGEEFIMLILLETAENALEVAERMRTAAQRTRVAADNSSITLSGGLVILGASETLEDAINRADELLYQSKQAGRNRITQG